MTLLIVARVGLADFGRNRMSPARVGGRNRMAHTDFVKRIGREHRRTLRSDVWMQGARSPVKFLIDHKLQMTVRHWSPTQPAKSQPCAISWTTQFARLTEGWSRLVLEQVARHAEEGGNGSIGRVIERRDRSDWQQAENRIVDILAEC